MIDGAQTHIVLTVNASWNVANFRRPLVSALLADGHRITVLAPRDHKVAEIERLGCEFVHLEMQRNGLSPISDFALYRRFRRHFRELQPDVVLSFTIKNNIYGAMAAGGLGIPFIPNITGLGRSFLSVSPLRKLVEFLYRRAFRRLDYVAFQNVDDLSLFRDARLLGPETQAVVLPGSGIDTGAFAMAPLPGDASDETVFLMIARLLRDKGVAEYREAARRLKRNHPRARFQLLGGTANANSSALSLDEVARWQEAGDIEYLGSVEDVRPHIAEADCVVLPSYREGSPRTLKEGAAMGRPLVATDVPGCRNLVIEGENGFLCEPRCAVSLARAMERVLLASPERRRGLGKVSRQHVVTKYDSGLVIDIYRRMIASSA